MYAPFLSRNTGCFVSAARDGSGDEDGTVDVDDEEDDDEDDDDDDVAADNEGMVIAGITTFRSPPSDPACPITGTSTKKHKHLIPSHSIEYNDNETAGSGRKYKYRNSISSHPSHYIKTSQQMTPIFY